MKKKIIFFTIFIIATSSLDALAVSNPAAKYCEDQGYISTVEKGRYGDLIGYCVFNNGNRCEEWAFFRGQCGPKDNAGVSCNKEGEEITSGLCCAGLVSISNPKRKTEGGCRPPLLGELGICSKCGNGSCEQWENICNCPEDCSKKERTKCGIQECNGLDITCGADIPQFCSAVYKMGDYCRKFARCEVVNGECRLADNDTFNKCKKYFQECRKGTSNNTQRLIDDNDCENDIRGMFK